MTCFFQITTQAQQQPSRTAWTGSDLGILSNNIVTSTMVCRNITPDKLQRKVPDAHGKQRRNHQIPSKVGPTCEK